MTKLTWNAYGLQQLMASFQRGHYTVLGDCIYILDLENVQKYTAMTSQFDEINDFPQGLAGFGWFGEESIDFTEVKNCPQSHKLGLCWA